LRDSLKIPIPAALIDRSSTQNAPSDRIETAPNTELPVIAAILPPVPSTVPLDISTDAPENVTDPQLTDEQIDFVGRLSSVNVPAMDIARLIERMRAGGAETGSADGDMNLDTAPPNYNDITG
jgi:hypothetical protein